MPRTIYYAAILPLTAKIRQNWRQEAVHLPAPAKLTAFTLIELSIVLVIIGLIVGGVLVGQDLIKTAQWRSLYSQVLETETAVRTFEMKYGCIPGDCGNAYQFFGSTCGTNNTSLVLGGCNGNSDSSIGLYNQWTQLISNSSNELVKFWTHLYMAGIGPQTNNQNMSSPLFQVTKNIPETSISNVGLSPYRNALQTGRNNPTSDAYYFPHGPFLTPTEAKMFDEKFDDGLPYRGRIGGGNGYGGYGVYPCISSSQYEVAQTGVNCYLNFGKIW